MLSCSLVIDQTVLHFDRQTHKSVIVMVFLIRFFLETGLKIHKDKTDGV